MTARGKRGFYQAVNYLLLAAALAVTILLIVKGDIGEGDRVMVCALVCIFAVFFQVHYLVHELGHLLFGLLMNFRAVSFTVAFVRFARFGKKISFCPHAAAAGACEMYPVGNSRLKGRVVVYSLGGAAMNFIFAATALLLYLLLAPSTALLVIAALAPLNLYEGVMELVPAELPAGKTDGAFVQGLLRGEASAQNAYAVLQAQSILAKDGFAALPRSLLYGVPVIREDDPAFLSLLVLRMMHAALYGEEERALDLAERLCGGLLEYLSPYAAGEAAADCASVFWLFENEQRAVSLMPSAKAAKGSCALLRICTLLGENEQRETFAGWEKRAKKLPMQGQREWEYFYLKRVKERASSTL